jgi:PKD repeat protein
LSLEASDNGWFQGKGGDKHVFAFREQGVLHAGTNSGIDVPPGVNQLGGLTRKRALIGLAALIVAGGFGLALLSNSGLIGHSAASPSFAGAGSSLSSGVSYVLGTPGNGSSLGVPGNTQVLGVETTATMTATSTSSATIKTSPGNPQPGQTNSSVSQGSPGGAGGLIEFSTSLEMTSSSPAQTASAVSALTYSIGGYVAYQSTYSTSAYVVIRVPAALYQKVLDQVMKLGAFVSETSNSNDVSVQYTDMNATLASLRTEQGALLKLLNQTTSINSTLAVETQLQQVDQQINDVESQILQTRTLIDYSTINVTIAKTPQQTPLTLALSVTPTNGTAPLSVTFNAIVKGGAQPYVVNFNFGDGYATEGQIVIHTYDQAGNYRIVVSATDQNGTVAQSTAIVKVVAAPALSNLSGFFGYVGNLFVSVVEGIVEVAVVVLPLAAVGAAIVIPIQRRGRSQRSIKQGQ